MDKSLSIFIADDNEINRLLLQSQLEDFCSNITFAADGKIALNYLQQYKYDLILLDIQMPYYSGLELIKIIKQKGTINQNSPTIAITAQAQSHQRKALIDAKFDECLIKPILVEQLEELVNLWSPISRPKKTTTEIDKNDYIAVLLQKTSGNTALATTLLNKLLTELPSQLFLIEQALKTNNLALAFDVTHKLHGSVSFCGFTDIQTLANKLETSLIEKDTLSLATQLEQLKKEVGNFTDHKDQLRSQLKLL